MSGRGGFSTGDVLVVVALLALGAAVVRPHLNRTRFEGQVDAAAAAVRDLADAARAYHEREGSWPLDAPPGSVPDELAGTLTLPDTTAFVVDWNLWKAVREPPEDSAPTLTVSLNPSPGMPPPPEPMDTLSERPPPSVLAVPGVSVRSGDPSLLAALLTRFGRSSSFVHQDTWTMILPPSPQNEPLGSSRDPA